MLKITEEDIGARFKNNKLWLDTRFKTEQKGKKASLRSYNLFCFDLRGAILSGALLGNTNLFA
jgi:hypothetical protein